MSRWSGRVKVHEGREQDVKSQERAMRAGSDPGAVIVHLGLDAHKQQARSRTTETKPHGGHVTGGTRCRRASSTKSLRCTTTTSPSSPRMDVSALRTEIKFWERDYKAQHGREPTVQDIKNTLGMREHYLSLMSCTHIPLRHA